MTRMRRAVAAAMIGVLSVGTLAGANMASAQTPDTVQCFAQVDERMYERTSPVFETQHRIRKQTRTITANDPEVVWTEWTNWSSGPVWDDGRNRGPAKHGGGAPGTVGYREFRYVETGETRQVDTGTTTTETSGWVLESPGDGWTLVDERTVDGEQIACPKPDDPDPVVSEWVDGLFVCDDVTVDQTRTVSTSVYVLDGIEWVLQGPTVVVETRTRDLSDDERTECPPVTTVPPTTEPPTTEPPLPPVTTDPPTTSPPSTEPPATDPPAVTIPPAPPTTLIPPVTAPPPTVPPAATTTTTTTVQAVPPSTQPPTTTPTPAPTGNLPQTGVGTWIIGLVALWLVAGGLVVLAGARGWLRFIPRRR